jgi:hypothetical protein
VAREHRRDPRHGRLDFNIHVQRGIISCRRRSGAARYFLDDLLFPLKQVLSGIGYAIFGPLFGIPIGFGRYGNQGQGRRGRGGGGVF